jgi:uncharacterized membrane protein (DUF485 family)
MSVMDQLFCFDNKLGYKFGQFLWLSFWVPSFIVLLADDTTGPSRDFLASASLAGCGTLMVYNVYRWADVPASAPAMQGILCELYIRWILIAYFGPSNILGSHTIGVMNWVQVICTGLFSAAKIPAAIYTLFHYKDYKKYENEVKESDGGVY